MSLAIGTAAPEFSLPADDGSVFQLAKARGERLVLVFYPADESPVCTAQLCEYRDGIEEFEGLNARVVGISKQDKASHQRFRANRKLPFTLLSDAKLEVAQLYGAKGLMGMKRACFIVDEHGVLRYQHVEFTALFARKREELIQVLKDLPAIEPKSKSTKKSKT